MPGYPQVRLRRLRRTAPVRRALRETHIPSSSLILPVFVDGALSSPKAIESLAGHDRWHPQQVGEVARRAEKAGLGGLLLFGRPRTKAADGRGAWDPKGAVPEALRTLRKERTGLLLVADVCLCAYTVDGHCGYWRGGELDNDASLPALVRTSLAYAQAGADWVAPSAMLDGQVHAVRTALDAKGLTQLAVLAYSAKAASAFYGPFRDAEGSTPTEGDRKGYQFDPANAREALREMETDLEEGADVLMVKPGLPQLDLLSRARERFNAPLAVYNVSGEYAMVKAAAKMGALDEPRAVHEVLTAFRRAGADLIISYHALEAAEKGWL